MKTLPASMVITTYNRSHLLDHSLARFGSTSNQSPTAPEQIIVVDDGGDDDCERICGLHRARGLNIEYVWHNHLGETNCCEARNIGLKLARHEALITSEPEVMFLTNVVAQLLDAREEWLMPKIVRGEAMPLFFGWCHHESEDGSVRRWKFPYVMLYPRTALLEIGGWDEELPGPWAWDDLDVFNRLEYLGHRQQLVDECEYRHQWHPSRIEPAVENEAYVRAKQLPRDLVANADGEWGVVRP